MSDMTDLFGPPISVYTVKDGVNDGVLVEAPAGDREEAGYHIPVTFTEAAYVDLVQWDDNPDQDQAGRLWDVLTMMRGAAKAAMASPGDRFQFALYRVPYLTKSGNRSKAEGASFVRRHVVAQGYDTQGTPCLTVLMPGED